MGFLSSLAKVAGVLAAPATGGASLAATLGSTALDIAGSAIGSQLSNKYAQGASNLAWDRSMYASNTSWQRGVADMRAAGLNPILAYSQGGASTPTAQAASTRGPDFSDTGSKMPRNALTASQIQNTQQSTRTSAAQERSTLESAENTRLNNEGLRALPPQYRALATMGASTGAGVAAGAHALKNSMPMLKQGVKNLQGWGSFFKQKSHDMYRGFSKGKR